MGAERPKPDCWGHGPLLSSHPNTFMRSCSHTLLSPVPDATSPVSLARRSLSAPGSRWAELHPAPAPTVLHTQHSRLLLEGAQKFSAGPCTKACDRQGMLGSKPADRNDLHAEAQPQKCHQAKCSVSANPTNLRLLESSPPAAPQEDISLSGAKAFLNNVFFQKRVLTYLESLFMETQAHWFSLFCSWPWIQERKTYPRTAFTTAAWQSTITCFVTVLLVWGFFPNMRLQIHFIH